jgi:hypothetical protein
MAADLVSWFLIEPGWKVEDSTGRNVGRVLEVTGDSNADIFDGLAIASFALAKPRYVPAEQVGEIVEGRVRVKLAEPAIEALPEYKEPPVEEDIESEKASAPRRMESAVTPPPTRSSDIPLLRRVLLWFGLTGRR